MTTIPSVSQPIKQEVIRVAPFASPERIYPAQSLGSFAQPIVGGSALSPKVPAEIANFMTLSVASFDYKMSDVRSLESPNTQQNSDSSDSAFRRSHSNSSSDHDITAQTGCQASHVMVAMGKQLRKIPLQSLHDGERTVTDMYADFDLSSLPLFKGGLINFGFWRGISLDHHLSDEERIRSEENLYHKLLTTIDLNANDDVLEVGCGLGYGCRIIAEYYKAQSITGLDFSPAQLARANERQAHLINSGKVQFVQGPAETMPLETNKYSAVISVEAAQHFRDTHAFIREAYRVLQSGKKLAFTTFFTTSTQAFSPLAEYIPTIKDKVDNVIPIFEALRMLQEEGFVDIQCSSIGADVWPGYDKWIQQTSLKDSWNQNWLKANEEGLLDYYMISATKI